MEDGRHLGPDPSELTTQQIWREIAALKELFETRLTAVENGIKVAHEDVVRVPTEVQKQVSNLKELHERAIASAVGERDLIRGVIETRLDGMDKAIELLQATADKFPARMDEKIASLREVHEEKFDSVQTQFKERDVRSEQSSKDSKVAVDAALQAQKEAAGAQNESNAAAINKSETTFTKQIDQLGRLIETSTRALDDKINDMKERLTRIEGEGKGVERSQTTQRASSSAQVALIAAIFAGLMSVIGLVVMLWRT